MGNRRLALLTMTVVAVLAVNRSAAASKGAPRGGSQRRSTSSHSARTHSSRKQRESQDRSKSHHGKRINGVVSRSERRPKHGCERHLRNQGSSTGSQERSSTSSSDYIKRSPRYKNNGNRDRRARDRGMDLVPSRASPPKANMFYGIATTLKSKAAVMQEEAKGKVKEWRNIAKTTVGFSSKMEKFMIQMTWPDDAVLDNQWVQDTMQFLESAGNESPRSPNNPNKRILRKLWLRMTEQDYRTKLKALQILHHTTMDLSPEASTRVNNQFLKMRDETNHKNRNEVYFEPTRIEDVTSSGMPFLPLLRSYSSYTFRRITELPEQVSVTLRSKKTSQAEAVVTLRRLDRLICAGTKCEVDRDHLNAITMQVLQLAAEDMMKLWKLYVQGLKRFIKGRFRDAKVGPPVVVEELLDRYTTTRRVLHKYLNSHKRIIEDRSEFDDNQLDLVALEAYLVSAARPQHDSEVEDMELAKAREEGQKVCDQVIRLEVNQNT